MTVRQLYNAVRGFSQKTRAQAELVEQQERRAWERARYQAFHIVNAWIKRGSKMRSPVQLGRFPWEKDTEKPTEKQWEEARKRFPDKLPAICQKN
ncbi:MAG: hypothetical protein JRJ57_00190 [Deltaproteobacteria bacterium]|nr:hypothetical protein [Deltaproteobacteria bacterium]